MGGVESTIDVRRKSTSSCICRVYPRALWEVVLLVSNVTRPCRLVVSIRDCYLFMSTTKSRRSRNARSCGERFICTAGSSGGLGILNPAQASIQHNKNSITVTTPLVDLLVSQTSAGSLNIYCELLNIKNKCRKSSGLDL